MKKYLIDLDGTMYHGTKIIEDSKKFIDYLIDNNHDFIFLTNNSSRTQIQACQHMLDMGYKNILPEHFYTSAMAASDHIKKHFDKRNAFVIGSDGLKHALINNGFNIVENNSDFVFVGLNTNLNYTDYSKAVSEILNGGILVSTNDDRILLTQNGPSLGNGSMVKMFEYCCSTNAIKIGKPNKAIIDGALEYTKFLKEDVVIIGDNLQTDILLGVNHNIKTILVTCGVHKRSDVIALNILPDVIVDKLTDLIIE